MAEIHVGLDDLECLFQPKRFYESMNYFANCSMHYKNGRMQISVHCRKKKKKERDGKKPEDDLIHPD